MSACSPAEPPASGPAFAESRLACTAAVIATDVCSRLLNYLGNSTTATLFTPLQAKYRRCPSGVATMLRTTPPPEGMGVVLKCFVLGSKRTSVFGCTPDSLYHTVPSRVTAMP